MNGREPITRHKTESGSGGGIARRPGKGERMSGRELITQYKAGERDFSGADLTGADLEGATVTYKQLARARSLKGATMPDGTKHG